MDALRLGLLGLTAAEESLVATLFRLHGVDRSFIWTLASEGPFDALLADEGMSDAALQPFELRKVPVMRLGPLGSEQEGVMARPIRSDLLVRWLNSIEVGILHGGHDSFATTSMESRVRSHLPGGLVSVPPFPIAPPAPVTPQSASLGRYKLRRWPAPALLAGDVARIRMATMLTRRFLSAPELAAASHVPEQACRAFVQQLLGASLLEEQKDLPLLAEATSVCPPADAAPKAEASTARGIGASLLRSIRQRLRLS